MSVKVVGLSETLREIQKIDKEAVKEIRKDFRRIAKPAIADIRWFMPDKTPLSRMSAERKSGRLAYDGRRADSRIGAYISSARPRKGATKTTTSLFRIEERDPAGSIIDMAGKKSAGGNQSRRVLRNGERRVLHYPQTFIENLRQYGGTRFEHPKPSRAMWPGVEKSLPGMVKETQKSIDDMMARLNRKAKYI